MRIKEALFRKDKEKEELFVDNAVPVGECFNSLNTIGTSYCTDFACTASIGYLTPIHMYPSMNHMLLLYDLIIYSSHSVVP